jgi:hypothetical protein
MHLAHSTPKAGKGKLEFTQISINSLLPVKQRDSSNLPSALASKSLLRDEIPSPPWLEIGHSGWIIGHF